MKVKYGPYSPSRLETANCPHRFKLQYIEKSVKDEGSLPARRGNVVHETFEELTKSWLVGKGLNWEQVTDILAEKMSKYLITDEENQAVCIQAAQAYMQNPPNGLDDILGTEEQIALKNVEDKWVTCDWDDPDAFCRGKIDLLLVNDDNIATIIDHKTQMYVCDANTFQMGFYAWMVKQAYPYVTEVRTMLHFCHPSLNFYSKPWSWDLDAMSNMETHIKIAIKIAEGMGEFPAIPNHHCQYCPIKMECPKLKELRKRKPMMKHAVKGPLLTAQEAQKHAEVLTVLNENTKDMKSNLQAFVKEIGPVQLPGLEYTMVVADSYKVPLANKKELVELLGEYGQNPYAYLDFSATNLKKLWKVLSKEQLEAVNVLLEPKKSTSFRARKV